MNPFRFSVSVSSAASRDELVSLARKAEDLGFDLLAVPDHLLDAYPPFLPLVTVAEATTRLRVGTLVLNNDLRHPALVAREAATLDQLTGGRFELGIGAGHARPEYESIGLPFDGAATRIARLAESVGIIKRLLSGETVSFEGEHYWLREHRCFPVPEVPPRILIGGNGKSLLRLAAGQADIVSFTGLGRTREDGQTHEPTGFLAEHLAGRVTLVRKAAGALFAALELNALVQSVQVATERAMVAEKLAARLAPLTPDDVLASPFLLLGTPEQMADDLRARRDRFGISYHSVFAHSMDAMARVIARVR